MIRHDCKNRIYCDDKYYCNICDNYEPEDNKASGIIVWLFVVLAAVMLLVGVTSCHASDGINIERLANAIYKAEGGNKTNHPYGILRKYKTTTPRQACINTIKHAIRDWDEKGDFITFLGNRYAPIGADNDPHGLNANWIKNVKYFYNK